METWEISKTQKELLDDLLENSDFEFKNKEEMPNQHMARPDLPLVGLSFCQNHSTFLENDFGV